MPTVDSSCLYTMSLCLTILNFLTQAKCLGAAGKLGVLGGGRVDRDTLDPVSCYKGLGV